MSAPDATGLDAKGVRVWRDPVTGELRLHAADHLSGREFTPGVWLPTDPESQEKRREAIARYFIERVGNIRWATKPLSEPIDWNAEADAVLRAIFGVT